MTVQAPASYRRTKTPAALDDASSRELAQTLVRRQKLQRDAVRQKRRRELKRKHKKIFGLPLTDHLVPLLLIALGHGDKDLTDHPTLVALLAPWVEQQVEKQFEILTRDSRDDDLRIQFADMKRELLKSGVA